MVVEEDAPATVATVIIHCDEFKAFPPGVPRTSRDVCECEPGNTKLGAECVPCSPGLWKQIIGDGQCINCPLVTESGRAHSYYLVSRYSSFTIWRYDFDC